jgi:hypothetical protein
MLGVPGFIQIDDHDLRFGQYRFLRPQAMSDPPPEIVPHIGAVVNRFGWTTESKVCIPAHESRRCPLVVVVVSVPNVAKAQHFHEINDRVFFVPPRIKSSSERVRNESKVPWA